MRLYCEEKELSGILVEEALTALTQKPVKCTTLERIRLFCEAKTVLSPQLPQPLQLGRGLQYVLERISLPLRPTDLLVGRISEEVPDAAGEAFIEAVVNDPAFPVACRPKWVCDGGHCSFYWKELMELGLSGLKARAETELARRTAAGDAQPRLDFLQGAIHIYEALQRYLYRWADAARAAGLEEAAAACTAVAQREPRTFREGLQLLWIIHLVFCTMVAGNPTLALGKMDRLLQPLYDADLAAGRLTRQEAGLLILDFYCKHNLIMGRGEHQMSDRDPELFSGWYRQLNCDAPQYLVLGGTNADGSSACTDLSLLFAECVVPRFKNPVMVIHYSPEMAKKHPAFWRVCVEKMRASASMMVYNEKDVVGAYIRAGADPQDAVEFEHFGCNWPCLPGLENDISQYHPEEDRLSTQMVTGKEELLPWKKPLVHNVREWVLSCAAEGRIPASIGELYEYLRCHMQTVFEQMVRKHRLYRDMVARKAPGVLLFADCFRQLSITSAANLDTGGSKYHTVITALPGVATLADSITAIDWLVFQKKKLTLAQLAKALEADFEGFAAVLALCRNAPKLGQDHELANAHARRIDTLWTDAVAAAQALPGDTPDAERLLFKLCLQTDTGHIAHGRETGATPDGRRAGAPLSQNCQPTEGASRNGLSARLCSMASLPFERILSGAQNISIQPRAFAGEAGLDLLAATLGTYFDMGGLQTQISAVSAEDLRAAQRDPEAHRDLMVRITGYSAVFTDMTVAAQNEIISREEMQAKAQLLMRPPQRYRQGEMTMKIIELGRSGLNVSELCMGAMNYGTYVDEAASFRLLDAFLDAGGNFIDTSNNYAHWAPGAVGDESEKLLGRWFAQGGRRDRVVLATKVGFDRHGVGAGLRAQQIERWCDESLRNLNTDVIDLYYAHVDDMDTPVEETMEAFDRLLRKGKVRAIGASNYYTWRLCEVAAACEKNGFADYTVLQQRYSYLFMENGLKSPYPYNEAASTEKLRYLARRGMPLVAYSCNAGGGYADESRLPRGFVKGERLDALKKMAAEKGIAPNVLQLAWMLHSWRFADRPQIVPLFSASSMEHLQENLSAAEVQLTTEEAALLNNA